MLVLKHVCELVYKAILLMRGKSDNCCWPPALHSWKSEAKNGGREGDAGRQLDQWEGSDAGPSIPHVAPSQSEAGDAGPSIPHMWRPANQGGRGVVVTV